MYELNKFETQKIQLNENKVKKLNEFQFNLEGVICILDFFKKKLFKNLDLFTNILGTSKV